MMRASLRMQAPEDVKVDMRPAEAIEHHAALVLRPGVEHAAPRVAGQQHLRVCGQSRIVTGIAKEGSAKIRPGSKASRNHLPQNT